MAFVLSAQSGAVHMLSGFMAESKGFFRRTPVHLRVASLLDHVGENSPPDCFLPQTSLLPPCSNPLYLFLPMQKAGLATCFSFWQRTLILIETILWGVQLRFGGGAVPDLRGCITLPVRTAINRRR